MGAAGSTQNQEKSKGQPLPQQDEPVGHSGNKRKVSGVAEGDTAARGATQVLPLTAMSTERSPSPLSSGVDNKGVTNHSIVRTLRERSEAFHSSSSPSPPSVVTTPSTRPPNIRAGTPKIEDAEEASFVVFRPLLVHSDRFITGGGGVEELGALDLMRGSKPSKLSPSPRRSTTAGGGVGFNDADDALLVMDASFANHSYLRRSPVPPEPRSKKLSPSCPPPRLSSSSGLVIGGSVGEPPLPHTSTEGSSSSSIHYTAGAGARTVATNKNSMHSLLGGSRVLARGGGGVNGEPTRPEDGEGGPPIGGRASPSHFFLPQQPSTPPSSARPPSSSFRMAGVTSMQGNLLNAAGLRLSESALTTPATATTPLALPKSGGREEEDTASTTKDRELSRDTHNSQSRSRTATSVSTTYSSPGSTRPLLGALISKNHNSSLTVDKNIVNNGSSTIAVYQPHLLGGGEVTASSLLPLSPKVVGPKDLMSSSDGKQISLTTTSGEGSAFSSPSSSVSKKRGFVSRLRANHDVSTSDTTRMEGKTRRKLEEGDEDEEAPLTTHSVRSPGGSATVRRKRSGRRRRRHKTKRQEGNVKGKAGGKDADFSLSCSSSLSSAASGSTTASASASFSHSSVSHRSNGEDSTEKDSYKASSAAATKPLSMGCEGQTKGVFSANFSSSRTQNSILPASTKNNSVSRQAEGTCNVQQPLPPPSSPPSHVPPSRRRSPRTSLYVIPQQAKSIPTAPVSSSGLRGQGAYHNQTLSVGRSHPLRMVGVYADDSNSSKKETSSLRDPPSSQVVPDGFAPETCESPQYPTSSAKSLTSRSKEGDETNTHKIGGRRGRRVRGVNEFVSEESTPARRTREGESFVAEEGRSTPNAGIKNVSSMGLTPPTRRSDNSTNVSSRGSEDAFATPSGLSCAVTAKTETAMITLTNFSNSASNDEATVPPSTHDKVRDKRGGGGAALSALASSSSLGIGGLSAFADSSRLGASALPLGSSANTSTGYGAGARPSSAGAASFNLSTANYTNTLGNNYSNTNFMNCSNNNAMAHHEFGNGGGGSMLAGSVRAGSAGGTRDPLGLSSMGAAGGGLLPPIVYGHGGGGSPSSTIRVGSFGGNMQLLHTSSRSPSRGSIPSSPTQARVSNVGESVRTPASPTLLVGGSRAPNGGSTNRPLPLTLPAITSSSAAQGPSGSRFVPSRPPSASCPGTASTNSPSLQSQQQSGGLVSPPPSSRAGVGTGGTGIVVRVGFVGAPQANSSFASSVASRSSAASGGSSPNYPLRVGASPSPSRMHVVASNCTATTVSGGDAEGKEHRPTSPTMATFDPLLVGAGDRSHIRTIALGQQSPVVVSGLNNEGAYNHNNSSSRTTPRQLVATRRGSQSLSSSKQSAAKGGLALDTANISANISSHQQPQSQRRDSKPSIPFHVSEGRFDRTGSLSTHQSPKGSAAHRRLSPFSSSQPSPTPQQNEGEGGPNRESSLHASAPTPAIQSQQEDAPVSGEKMRTKTKGDEATQTRPKALGGFTPIPICANDNEERISSNRHRGEGTAGGKFNIRYSPSSSSSLSQRRREQVLGVRDGDREAPLPFARPAAEGRRGSTTSDKASPQSPRFDMGALEASDARAPTNANNSNISTSCVFVPTEESDLLPSPRPMLMMTMVSALTSDSTLQQQQDNNRDRAPPPLSSLKGRSSPEVRVRNDDRPPPPPASASASSGAANANCSEEGRAVFTASMKHLSDSRKLLLSFSTLNDRGEDTENKATGPSSVPHTTAVPPLVSRTPSTPRGMRRHSVNAGGGAVIEFTSVSAGGVVVGAGNSVLSSKNVSVTPNDDKEEKGTCLPILPPPTFPALPLVHFGTTSVDSMATGTLINVAGADGMSGLVSCNTSLSGFTVGNPSSGGKVLNGGLLHPFLSQAGRGPLSVEEDDHTDGFDARRGWTNEAGGGEVSLISGGVLAFRASFTAEKSNSTNNTSGDLLVDTPLPLLPNTNTKVKAASYDFQKPQALSSAVPLQASVRRATAEGLADRPMRGSSPLATLMSSKGSPRPISVGESSPEGVPSPTGSLSDSSLRKGRMAASAIGASAALAPSSSTLGEGLSTATNPFCEQDDRVQKGGDEVTTTNTLSSGASHIGSAKKENPNWTHHNAEEEAANGNGFFPEQQDLFESRSLSPNLLDALVNSESHRKPIPGQHIGPASSIPQALSLNGWLSSVAAAEPLGSASSKSNDTATSTNNQQEGATRSSGPTAQFDGLREQHTDNIINNGLNKSEMTASKSSTITSVGTNTSGSGNASSGGGGDALSMHMNRAAQPSTTRNSVSNRGSSHFTVMTPSAAAPHELSSFGVLQNNGLELFAPPPVDLLNVPSSNYSPTSGGGLGVHLETSTKRYIIADAGSEASGDKGLGHGASIGSYELSVKGGGHNFNPSANTTPPLRVVASEAMLQSDANASGLLGKGHEATSTPTAILVNNNNNSTAFDEDAGILSNLLPWALTQEESDSEVIDMERGFRFARNKVGISYPASLKKGRPPRRKSQFKVRFFSHTLVLTETETQGPTPTASNEVSNNNGVSESSSAYACAYPMRSSKTNRWGGRGGGGGRGPPSSGIVGGNSSATSYFKGPSVVEDAPLSITEEADKSNQKNPADKEQDSGGTKSKRVVVVDVVASEAERAKKADDRRGSALSTSSTASSSSSTGPLSVSESQSSGGGDVTQERYPTVSISSSSLPNDNNNNNNRGSGTATTVVAGGGTDKPAALPAMGADAQYDGSITSCAVVVPVAIQGLSGGGGGGGISPDCAGLNDFNAPLPHPPTISSLNSCSPSSNERGGPKCSSSGSSLALLHLAEALSNNTAPLISDITAFYGDEEEGEGEGEGEDIDGPPTAAGTATSNIIKNREDAFGLCSGTSSSGGLNFSAVEVGDGPLSAPPHRAGGLDDGETQPEDAAIFDPLLAPVTIEELHAMAVEAGGLLEVIRGESDEDNIKENAASSRSKGSSVATTGPSSRANSNVQNFAIFASFRAADRVGQSHPTITALDRNHSSLITTPRYRNVPITSVFVPFIPPSHRSVQVPGVGVVNFSPPRTEVDRPLVLSEVRTVDSCPVSLASSINASRGAPCDALEGGSPRHQHKVVVRASEPVSTTSNCTTIKQKGGGEESKRMMGTSDFSASIGLQVSTLGGLTSDSVATSVGGTAATENSRLASIHAAASSDHSHSEALRIAIPSPPHQTHSHAHLRVMNVPLPPMPTLNPIHSSATSTSPSSSFGSPNPSMTASSHAHNSPHNTPSRFKRFVMKGPASGQTTPRGKAGEEKGGGVPAAGGAPRASSGAGSNEEHLLLFAPVDAEEKEDSVVEPANNNNSHSTQAPLDSSPPVNTKGQGVEIGGAESLRRSFIAPLEVSPIPSRSAHASVMMTHAAANTTTTVFRCVPLIGEGETQQRQRARRVLQNNFPSSHFYYEFDDATGSSADSSFNERRGGLFGDLAERQAPVSTPVTAVSSQNSNNHSFNSTQQDGHSGTGVGGSSNDASIITTSAAKNPNNHTNNSVQLPSVSSGVVSEGLASNGNDTPLHNNTKKSFVCISSAHGDSDDKAKTTSILVNFDQLGVSGVACPPNPAGLGAAAGGVHLHVKKAEAGAGPADFFIRNSSMLTVSDRSSSSIGTATPKAGRGGGEGVAGSERANASVATTTTSSTSTNSAASGGGLFTGITGLAPFFDDDSIIHPSLQPNVFGGVGGSSVGKEGRLQRTASQLSLATQLTLLTNSGGTAHSSQTAHSPSTSREREVPATLGTAAGSLKGIAVMGVGAEQGQGARLGADIGVEDHLVKSTPRGGVLVHPQLQLPRNLGGAAAGGDPLGIAHLTAQSRPLPSTSSLAFSSLANGSAFPSPLDAAAPLAAQHVIVASFSEVSLTKDRPPTDVPVMESSRKSNLKLNSIIATTDDERAAQIANFMDSDDEDNDEDEDEDEADEAPAESNRAGANDRRDRAFCLAEVVGEDAWD